MPALFFLEFNNGIGQEGEFDTFLHGAWHGTFVAIVFGLPILLVSNIYLRVSWKTIIALFVFWVVCLAIMGGIVDAFHHWPNELE